MSAIRIGLLGYGTVGSAVHRMLTDRAARIRRVTGRDVELAAALVRDRARHPPAAGGVLTTDFARIRDDPSISVVAEVMGGVEPTREHVLALLDAGKSVVSANKQLLARHGEELFARAEARGVQLRFEASVCAAIPVVKVLRESLIAADVNAIDGIVNGTTNYILTAMVAQGTSYVDALAGAQRLGYAEADPTEDVNGADAAAKIAILASIAFHTRVRLEEVERRGIDDCDAADVSHAGELGYSVKLIASARMADGRVAARVGPSLVRAGHPLASVDGAFNAVMLRGNGIREMMLRGPGAGGEETATAVLGDLLAVIGTQGTGFLQHDGYYRTLGRLPVRDLVSAFYLRVRVEDQPGVLAQVAQHLAGEGVSVAQVVQHQPASPGAAVDVAILTHEAREGAARSAVERIAALPFNRSAPVLMPVLQ
jgi:homoserine dehydrogenase